ncbi:MULTISPECIES: hypothetical protein [Vibrio]|uniref:hypothetical protein n=1 Tax=Vibrio TaxID=662 RepID=UPI000C827F06|nr:MULTISPECIES: hypothetical protein [Vibrio]MCG9694966.1 hypothetical protein [Vibrio sp. Isolate22]PMG18474.1 hypothetical protein BCU97_23540 [Vibrio splendidus]PMH91909.1 hypothetical protein BCU56_11255 [Vibrio lentus]PMJ42989.1 hypothetical protein BCU24_07470 [Vibrio cyclitrophicus]PTO65502.1 hypothetical protein CWN96_12830 [Vibrio splendidus]
MKTKVGSYFLLSCILIILGFLWLFLWSCNYDFYTQEDGKMTALATELKTCKEIINFDEFYAKNIRGHLFAGFLALGGFLMSLKTFIIVNMKENVYDNKKYKETWDKQKNLNKSIGTLYQPLRELSDILFYAILASIIAAVMQMTVGFISSIFASILCILSAVFASILLLQSLRIIKSNLNRWFEYLDDSTSKEK